MDQIPALRRIPVARAFQVMIAPLSFALFALSHLIPRRQDQWVFGSWSGKRFTDNAAAMFRYVSALDQGPVPLWITTSRSVAREVRRRGLKARYRWSPRGMVACARAGVWIYDGTTKDINFFLCGGALKVLLRHGVGIKRIERAITNPGHHLYRLFHGNTLERFLLAAALPWHLVKPDLAIATSEEHARQAVDFYGVDREAVHVTGFPRYDALFEPPSSRSLARVEQDAVDRIEGDSRPSFLFLPTFRDGKLASWNWSELDAAADDAHVRLYAKPHLVDATRPSGSTDHDDLRSVRFVDPSVDPISLYGSVTGVITDYSSVALDAILIGLPVIYFVPDLEDYRTTRGLYYDFDTVSPGYVCQTTQELRDALAATATTGIGRFRDEYESMRHRFHAYTSGGASERVYRVVEEAVAQRRWRGRADAG